MKNWPRNKRAKHFTTKFSLLITILNFAPQMDKFESTSWANISKTTEAITIGLTFFRILHLSTN